MKKRYIQTIFAAMAAAVVFFTGCPTDGGGTGDGETSILFKNESPYAVDVYSDSGRGNEAAAVPAGGESRLAWTPSPGSSFYLTYQMPVVDGILIPYERSAVGPYPIDEGKTTTITIESPDSSPALLTDQVYLLLYHEGSGAGFHLERQGGTVIPPEKVFDSGGNVASGANLVSPQERAWYIVSAGSVDAYSVTASGEQKPFPGSVTEFQGGWFYTFRYEDGGLVPGVEYPLSLERLLTRSVVLFDANGGTPETQTRSVDSGASLGAANMPSDPVQSGSIFGGWWTAKSGGTQFTADTPVSGNITVYAKWSLSVSVPDDLSLDASLAWIADNASEGNAYIITLRGNETIAPKTLSYSGKTVSVILKGDTTERTVSLRSKGNLFIVESGVTLTLGENITLQGGLSDNTDALMRVNSGGTLVMESGAKITSNTGSGVSVYGAFTMDGGEISGNTGGVVVDNMHKNNEKINGTFTMNGGKISGNAGRGVSVPATFIGSWDGEKISGAFTMNGGKISGNTSGGVGVSGTFTMNDGEISGNTGDGVSVSGTFTMNGGEISGNTVSGVYGGGGVSVNSNGTFTMSGGEINGNTASLGGGVYVRYSTFTMSGGEISGNTVAYYGGGVYVDSDSTFTMSGGAISGNTASDSSYSGYGGGGVYVRGTFYEQGEYVIGGRFTKQSGGIIYGSDADDALKNTAATGNGHAVYVVYGDNISPEKKRNTTAGEGVTLNSSSSGAEGGWVDRYTVTFDADGGSPATQTTTVNNGDSVGSSSMPTAPSKDGYAFDGWHTAQNGGGERFTATTTVAANIRVYAKWVEPSPPPNLTVAESLAWLDRNAQTGREYTFTLSGNESIAPQTLSYSGKTVSITFIGGTVERTVSLSSSGSLFTVGSGITLTLGENVTLQGLSDNTASLAQVNRGGRLIMESGSKITGNTSSSSGGGVYVIGGTFTMSGGEISGNTVSGSYAYGGGVSVDGGTYVGSGTFTMSGGEISGNTSVNGGGGVSVGDGTFTMSGGAISGNTTSNGRGGGVSVNFGGTFTMNSGEISGNTAASSGGGVNVNGNGTFTMSGGEISGNTASGGGGVNVNDNSGTFTMSGGAISGNTTSNGGGGGVSVAFGTFTQSGGAISGNTANASGGGVSVAGGTFTMSGGEISGNTANTNGGGVSVYSATFTKESSGTIYGSDAADDALKNTASSDSYGHAVYVSSARKRNTTAGEGVTLNSSLSGATGGWVD